MNRVDKGAIIAMAIGAVIGLALLFGIKHIIQNPITLQHPAPNLTRKYPILKDIDKLLHLTAGVRWYNVVEKETGDIYLIHFGWDRKTYKNRIKIINDETRDAWQEISTDEYMTRFFDRNKVHAPHPRRQLITYKEE